MFLILVGLAVMSNNPTLQYIGIGVGVIFLVSMGGAHHAIVALVALGIIGFGVYYDMVLPSLLVAGGLFMVFVMHGREEPQAGFEGYPVGGMGGLGLPPGY